MLYSENVFFFFYARAVRRFEYFVVFFSVPMFGVLEKTFFIRDFHKGSTYQYREAPASSREGEKTLRIVKESLTHSRHVSCRNIRRNSFLLTSKQTKERKKNLFAWCQKNLAFLTPLHCKWFLLNGSVHASMKLKVTVAARKKLSKRGRRRFLSPYSSLFPGKDFPSTMNCFYLFFLPYIPRKTRTHSLHRKSKRFAKFSK